MKDDYICSWVVGQKHETPLSSSLIASVKFSLTALRILIWATWWLLFEKCQWCLLLLARFIFKRMPCYCTVCSTHKLFGVWDKWCYGCTVGQLFRGHTDRNTMQYYSALLIPLTAMSALDVPKYTENNVHTHTSSFPQRTWSTLRDFWGPSPMSVFIYSCSSVQRSFIVSLQTVGVGDWRSRPLAAVILPDEAVCAA